MNVSTHSALTRGLLRAAGELVARTASRRRLCILTYHRVLEQPTALLDSEPDLAAFRWQMALLADCFNVLPLADALALLESGRLPPRAVCITFDDGYRSVYDLALPVLKEFGLPATVFVTSGHVGSGNMWNDRIMAALQNLPPRELDLSDAGLGRFSLRTLADRKDSLRLLTEASKYLPPAARSALVRRLEAMAGSHGAEDLMLSSDMVVALDRNGVEIGAHTITHPILTSLDDDAARHEIGAGKRQLEALTGRPVRLFAYPNGKAGKDFDARHVAMVREAGFDAAFTTAAGAADQVRDRYQLPRSRPWDRTPLLFGLRLLRWLARGASAMQAPEHHKIAPPRIAAPQKAGASLPLGRK